MKIHFLGAAKKISGTCFWIEAGKKQMLVDCGLFQGKEDMRMKNYEPFPFDPKAIDYVFLTHAHADHIGRVPKLVQEGFKGKIFATEPTREFFPLMLEDSAKHLKREARALGQKPLYTQGDIESARNYILPLSYGEKTMLDESCSVRLSDAGHILGSAIIEIFVKEGKKERILVFSGDLGNSASPLLPSPAKIKNADVVVVESTYGGRFHEDVKTRKDMLEDVIEEVVKNKGTLLIPAFSLERIQMILYELHTLIDEKMYFHKINESTNV